MARLIYSKTVPGSYEDLRGIAEEIFGTRKADTWHGDQARLRVVVEQLAHLGQVLLAGMYDVTLSPSASDLAARLKDVAELAGALEQALLALPPFSLEMVNDVYHVHRTWDPTSQTMQPTGDGPATAQRSAAVIHEIVQQQLTGWQENRTTLGQVSPTHPGPTRAYQRIAGDPRTFIADQVAQLIAREIGVNAVSAEDNTPVYNTFVGLWTWATGLPEEGADLRKHIRKGVRSALAKSTWAANRAEIDKEYEEHYRWVLAGNYDPLVRRAYQLRVRQLEAEADRLREADIRSFGTKPKRQPKSLPE